MHDELWREEQKRGGGENSDLESIFRSIWSNLSSWLFISPSTGNRQITWINRSLWSKIDWCNTKYNSSSNFLVLAPKHLFGRTNFCSFVRLQWKFYFYSFVHLNVKKTFVRSFDVKKLIRKRMKCSSIFVKQTNFFPHFYRTNVWIQHYLYPHWMFIRDVQIAIYSASIL